MKRRDFILAAAVTKWLTPLQQYCFATSKVSTKHPLGNLKQVLRPETLSSPRNTEGDFVVLRDGRWLIVWSDFSGGATDRSNARISGIYSSDAGATWSEPTVILPNSGKMNTMSPSFLRLSGEKLGLFYSVTNSEADQKFYLRSSDNEGQTWSDPVCITPDEGYNSGLNANVVRLKSGRLLLPSHFSPEKRQGGVFVARVHYSDDVGKTWRHSASDVGAPKRGAMEPCVIELTDGRVLLIARTQMGTIYRAWSRDGGVSWSMSEPMRYKPKGQPILAPEAPCKIVRIPKTGHLLLVWNHNFEPAHRASGKRTPLTAAISRDEGESWTKIKNLEDDPERRYQYASVRFVEDQVVLVYSENFSLKLNVIPVNWFYQ